MSVITDSAPITSAIHTSGTMACRDQPRADRQCLTIRTTTMTVSATPAAALSALTASQAGREPRTSSRFAGQLASQPLNAGSQNSIPSRLKPAAEAYSATTTPRSNRERSRPVGQARPRWARAAPARGTAAFPIVNPAESSR